MIKYLFPTIILTILCSGYYYVGRRLISPAGLTGAAAVAAWSALVLLLILPPLPIILRASRVAGAWNGALPWVSYTVLGFFALLFFLVLGADLVRLTLLVWNKAGALIQHAGLSGREIIPSDPDRRRFVVNSVNLGIIVSAGGLSAIGFRQARMMPKVAEVPVYIAGLHPDLEGFRIVQITDIHVGDTISGPFVRSVVDTVNSLSADIVALTGDLVDGTVEKLREDVAPLASVASRYGRYFITGNHEYYSGARPWIEEIARLGYRVLIRDHLVIRHGAGRLLLAGVTDYNADRFIAEHRSSPTEAIAGAPPSDVKILLAHQPRSIYDASVAGFDLQISGHTHGGQFYPFKFFVGLQQPYISGLHKHENTWIYVSRGTGYWGPPLRLGIPSEITLLTLTGKDPAGGART